MKAIDFITFYYCELDACRVRLPPFSAKKTSINLQFMILAHSCSPSVAQGRAFQSPGPEQRAALHARADLPRTTQLFELPAANEDGRRRERG